MSTLTEICQALANRLGTLDDSLQKHYFPPAQVVPPAVVVSPGPGTFLLYGRTFDDDTDLELTVLIVAKGGQRQSAFEELYDYLADSGPRSVFACLEADPTLGGVVDSTAVLSAGGFGSYRFGELSYPGVEFAIGVLV
jgi:hypothetical protein